MSALPAKNFSKRNGKPVPPVPKKILVAVDGSESAYRATDYAISLAKKLGSKVYFIHVVDVASYPAYKVDLSDYLEVENSFEDRGNEILSNCAEKAKKKKVSSESFLMVGDPSSKIAEFADDKKCDCIVMGKRGMGKLERILVGSVTEQVTKLANAPSIIVK